MLTKDPQITTVPTTSTEKDRWRRPRKVVLTLVALVAIGGAAGVAVRDDGHGGSGRAPETPLIPFVVDDVPAHADGTGSVDG